MRVLTEETLKRALLWTEKQYHPLMQWFIDHGLEDINPWLPIENAPKDRPILLLWPNPIGAMEGFWLNDCWYSNMLDLDGAYMSKQPTHYQELPEEPKE